MISLKSSSNNTIKAPLIIATVKNLIYQHFMLGRLFMKFIQVVKELDENIEKKIHINFTFDFH